MTPIAPLIETFLRDTLARQRGASRHTSDSYASSFQLLFVFAADRLKVKPSALTLEQIDAGTRQRLPRVSRGQAQERGRDAQRPAGGYQVVLPLPGISATGRARADPPRPGDPVQENGSLLVPYLLRDELQAVLDAPDPATQDGIRDHAMLHVAVCAGLRVSS